MKTAASILQTSTEIASRASSTLTARELVDLFGEAREAMLALGPEVRPLDNRGLPGALAELPPDLPAIIVPDLHARPALFPALLRASLPESRGLPRGNIADLLVAGEVAVVFAGDAPHSEGPESGARWTRAWREYLSGWRSSPAMDEEMSLAINATEMIARLTALCPGRFFFIKGNHDNIRNRAEGGDHPFGKYAEEGAMSLSWSLAKLGEEWVEACAAFEDALPLMVRGGGFLVSHAEPRFALTPQLVIDARLDPEVVEALIWTDNDAAEPEAARKTLAAFFGAGARPGVMFAGHRPVADKIALRAGGLLVQIHDRKRMQATCAVPGSAFDPIADIIDLGASS